ncbi:unnamed protein product [Oikopleura dioica]|uniref:Uncharacterized protein n=1 Tax=Oikopleura dioica TaxID=34765 RepID=E4YP05_OIKDI|nr:unnamed protein product [Oikopleura dioica]CBY40787.1 unnamed protein product [Oikopleura dioica]
MFVFNRKIFLKLIKSPLISSTDKRSRFRGYTPEQIREILANLKSWTRLTEKRQGKTSGVIVYLSGLICNQPEKVFDDFTRGRELAEKRLQIERKLALFLRVENFGFRLENQFVLEEKLGQREARTGLSQLLESTELEELDEPVINVESHLEEPEINEESLEESQTENSVAEVLIDDEVFELTQLEEPEINEESQLEELEESQADMSVAEVLVDDEGVEKEVTVDEAVVEELENETENSDNEECSVLNIFEQSGKLPIDPKGGRRTTWSCKFIQQSIELLSSGESASSCLKFFTSLAKHYPELLGEGKKVPAISWFERLRDGLPFLNAEHTKDSEGQDRAAYVGPGGGSA